MKPQHCRIFRDEVDMIVDAIVANPARADEYKSKLRLAIAPKAGPKPAADDVEDFWDNVPI